MAYDERQTFNDPKGAWIGGQPIGGVYTSQINTPPKESPLAVLDRGVGRVAEMMMRLETMADRLAGTRPEEVQTMAGAIPSVPAVAHQINSHGIALDNLARRMQSALDRIEQAFG